MPLYKSSRLDRDIAKYERRLQKSKQKRVDDRAERLAWDTLSEAVHKRDHGQCRVCGRSAELYHANPKRQGTAHHLVYRSAGGSDDRNNLIWICRLCHRDEHEHRIEISGDGNGEITITRHHPESGRVLEMETR